MENAMYKFNQAPAIEASIVRVFAWLRIKTV